MVITVTLNPAIDKTVEVRGFRVGAHARARVRAALPAGKGVNVARGLARLGGQAAASGFIGRDEEALFAQSLSEDGVEARFCTVAGRTRTNTTILDPEGRTTTHLREQGFEVGVEDLAALQATLSALLKASGAGTVVFAGGLPVGMRPADFASLVLNCADQGAAVVVDTNGPALRAVLRTGAVDTLKPNLSELAECLGRAVNGQGAAAAAADLLGQVGRVLVTLGAEGALLVRPDGLAARRCPVAESELRNTVGCGDAFLAGWLRGLQVCDDEAAALGWAVAAGAASARSESTVGYTLRDVEELLPVVSCQ